MFFVQLQCQILSDKIIHCKTSVDTFPAVLDEGQMLHVTAFTAIHWLRIGDDMSRLIYPTVWSVGISDTRVPTFSCDLVYLDKYFQTMLYLGKLLLCWRSLGSLLLLRIAVVHPITNSSLKTTCLLPDTCLPPISWRSLVFHASVVEDHLLSTHHLPSAYL